MLINEGSSSCVLLLKRMGTKWEEGGHVRGCVACSSLSIRFPIGMKTIKSHVVPTIFWTPFSPPSTHFGKDKPVINICAIESLLLFIPLSYCWPEKDKFIFVFVMLFLMVEERSNCNYGNNAMIPFFFFLLFKNPSFLSGFIDIQS